MISHPPGFLAKIWPLAKIAEPASGSNSLAQFRISASQKNISIAAKSFHRK